MNKKSIISAACPLILNEYINKLEHINRIIEINIQNRRFTLCASSIARFIRLHSSRHNFDRE